MDITVREMKENDYAGVREVDVQSQIQYLGASFSKLSEIDQDKSLVSRKSEWNININTGYCFVAEAEDKILGFLMAHETVPFIGSVFIRYLAINPVYQGKGIGLLLYKALIDKAKSHEIKEISGLINVDNPHSVSLAIKAGFKIVDRKEAVWWQFVALLLLHPSLLSSLCSLSNLVGGIGIEPMTFRM
jgi:L-amino acid N-acyltransferase YncA